MDHNEILQSIFDATMQREKIKVQKYYPGIAQQGESYTFDAFFRINNDNNDITDKNKLYYRASEDVNNGDLIKYKENIYILINKETEECDVYRKSSALKTNCKIKDIPFFAYDMQSPTPTTNNTINVIDGYMELITSSHDDIITKFQINDKFNAMLRTWVISNMYAKDGILHLIAEITTDDPTVQEHEYSIVLSELIQTYTVNDTATLTATVYIDGIATTESVIFASSNDDIATIDSDGNINFISDGVVEFNATYDVNGENKASASTQSINVLPIPMQEDHFTATITGNEEITYNRNRTYTATLYNNGVTVDESACVWDFAISPNYKHMKTVNGNTLTIKITDSDAIDYDVTITAMETNTGANASITCYCASPF